MKYRSEYNIKRKVIDNSFFRKRDTSVMEKVILKLRKFRIQTNIQ